jgi:hypothetical protein
MGVSLVLYTNHNSKAEMISFFVKQEETSNGVGFMGIIRGGKPTA